MPPRKTGSAPPGARTPPGLPAVGTDEPRGNAIIRDYRARFGVSVAEWRAMAVLGQFGPASASEICAHNEMDEVTVSHAANSLLSRELVRSRTDVNDRRRMIHALTRSGRGVHGRIAPMALVHEARLLGALSTREGDHRPVFWTSFSAKQTRAPSRRNAL